MFSHLASWALVDQTRSHLAFPPPPAGVCPLSAVSSFSACIPGGQSVRRANFRPVCPPLVDWGPFRTQPEHPRLLPRLFHRGRSPGPGPRARGRRLRGPSRRNNQAAPGGAPWKGSRLQLGNPLGGENPCQGIQLSGLKLQTKNSGRVPCLRPRHAPREFSAEMQQVASGARGVPCAA